MTVSSHFEPVSTNNDNNNNPVVASPPWQPRLQAHQDQGSKLRDWEVYSLQLSAAPFSSVFVNFDSSEAGAVVLPGHWCLAVALVWLTLTETNLPGTCDKLQGVLYNKSAKPPCSRTGGGAAASALGGGRRRYPWPLGWWRYDCVGGVNTQDDATHAGSELPPQWLPTGR